MKPFWAIACLYAVAGVAIFALSSCTYTQSADGSRSFSVDGGTVVKVIEAK